MKTDKNILLILAVILASFAAWRVCSYRASHGQKNPAIVENLQQAVATKSAELFEDKPLYPSKNYPYDNIQQQNQNSYSTPYANATSSGNVPTTFTNTQQFSSNKVVPNTGKTQAVSGTSYTTGYNSTTTNGNITTPTASFSSSRSTYAPTGQEQMAQERAANLFPYLAPNKETQRKLSTSLQDLNDSITRAIQAALTPKSKKEANIEKYLHKDTSSASAATVSTPFQEMLTQMNTQKKEVVKSVANAYGAEAGQRAENLMNNFQKELTTEVSKKDQPIQTTAQNVQKIAQKYQQKFDQMNQQNQYNQYVKDLTNQYEKQVTALKQLYPGQQALNEEFSRISNDALKKELSLSAKNMTPEEYTKARYAIQYDMHQELENAIKKAGASLTELHQYDNANAQNILNDLQNKEETGAIVSVPRKASEEETKAISKTLNDEQNNLLSQVKKTYGEQGVEDFKPVLDSYYQQMMQTMQEPMSAADRYQAQLNLRIEYNRRILEMQRDAILKMDIPREQKEANLATIEKEINALPKI